MGFTNGHTHVLKMRSANNTMERIRDIWQFRYYVGSKIFESLGVLMLLYELLTLIKPIEDVVSNHKSYAFIIIVLISLCYALCGLFCPPKKITLDINKRTRLNIRQGNLMEADGVKIIPVNEYFDTHLGDGIINKKSIHGQFLSLYEGHINELRNKIDKQLEKFEALPSNRNRTMVPNLPNKRYPVGTCIRIVEDEQYYILVAVTRFDEYEHVEVSTEEFPEVVRKMFNGIEHLQDGKPVYLPLVGSGISGYELTNMQILNTIVQAAQMANRLCVTNGLNLYIYSDEQMNSINLNVIKYLYNRWITLK